MNEIYIFNDKLIPMLYASNAKTFVFLQKFTKLHLINVAGIPF